MHLEQIARIRAGMHADPPSPPDEPRPEPLVPMAEDTREAGRRGVAAVRDELHRVRRPSPNRSLADPPKSEPWSDDPRVMAAQMAAGAERERLVEQVRELSAENDRLRAVLRDIVRRAADGV